jgi:uncharacterized protein
MRDPAASPSPPTAGRVGLQHRIHTLDILRGFALFGMIVVHFHQFVHTPATGLEDLIGWVVWVGLETKSWGTFAFLFGVGFAILLRRAQQKGLPFVAIYLRRLVVLALFGVIAEAVFGFKVLLEYALWGAPLLVLRRFSTRTLCIVAVFAAAAHPLLSAGAAMHFWPPSRARRLEGTRACLPRQLTSRISMAALPNSLPRGGSGCSFTIPVCLRWSRIRR